MRFRFISVLSLLFFFSYSQPSNTFNLTYTALNGGAVQSQAIGGLEYGNNKVFYVDDNGFVTYFEKNGAVWQTTILNILAPKARLSTDLAYDSDSDRIFYITEDDKVGCLWWNTNLPGTIKYDFNYLSYVNDPKVHGDQYSLVYGNDKLFFIDQNNTLRYFEAGSGGWQMKSLPRATVAR